MLTKKIPIGEASDAQLRAFAKHEYDLKIHHASARRTILHELEQLHGDNDWIMIAEDDAPVRESDGPAGAGVTAHELTGGTQPSTGRSTRLREHSKLATSERLSREYFQVRLGRPSAYGAQQDTTVPVSVNGDAMHIPVGKDVFLRRPYIEALQNARRKDYEQLDDIGNLLEIMVDDYPLSVMSGPYIRLAEHEYQHVDSGDVLEDNVGRALVEAAHIRQQSQGHEGQAVAR